MHYFNMKQLLTILIILIASISQAQKVFKFYCLDKDHVFATTLSDSQTDSVYTIEFNSTFPKDSTTVEIFKNKDLTGLLTSIKILGKSCFTKYYYPNGQLKDYTILESPEYVNLLYQERYFENGQLYFKLDYGNDSIQKVINYWPNGQKHCEYFWFKGTILGEYIEWHENGQIHLRGNFINWPWETISKQFCVSTPDGEWTYWNNDGTIEKVEIYKDGEVIETINK